MRRSGAIGIGVTIAAITVFAGAARVPAPTSFPAEIATMKTMAPVSSFALAKTVSLAATVSTDAKVRIVDIGAGMERRQIDIAGRRVDVFAFSADGQHVAIGDHAGLVTVWDAGTGQRLTDIRLSHYPGVAVFSHDGKRLATAAQGDPIRVFDVVTGTAVIELGAPAGGTNAIAFSRDDTLIATGDGDTVVRIYDAATGQAKAENRDLRMVPLAVAFTSDGTAVIAGSGDKSVLYIEAATGKTRTRHRSTSQPVSYLEVSPDGDTVAAVFMKSENMTEPDHVVLWSRGHDVLVDWLPPALPAGGGWTNDGRLLVAVPSSDGLHLWRLR